MRPDDCPGGMTQSAAVTPAGRPPARITTVSSKPSVRTNANASAAVPCRRNTTVHRIKALPSVTGLSGMANTWKSGRGSRTTSR